MSRSRHILVALGFCVAAGVASAAVTDGLISAWTFNDGTGKDMKGVSDAVLKGAAKVVDGGKIGKALDVNGTKDTFGEIAHKSAYDAITKAYTVSAWAFVRKGDDHSAIVWKGEKIGWGTNFTFRIATTSDTGVTLGSCSDAVEGWFAASNSIKPNVWFHIAQTSDGKKVDAYINGKAVAITDNAAGAATAGPYKNFPNRPIELGVGRAQGGTVGNDKWLNGVIDEVALYGRGMTAAEIGELMNANLGGSATAVDSLGKAATTWGSLKSR